MLFNSYVFVLAFLPIVVFGFFLLGRNHARASVVWLVIASLVYYCWWNPVYLLLIFFSILFNFTTGLVLDSSRTQGLRKKTTLTAGIIVNLSLLGYFKYTNFFVASMNAIAGEEVHLAPIVLPLAISFFTFQQIAYLVDSYRDLTHEHTFIDYCLFVTFFPQLIAGPIVHHGEMLPQFRKRETFQPRWENIAVGFTIFSMGLFKKVIFADQVAEFATPVFSAAAEGHVLSVEDAWVGALAYSLQLYFDFSGYSDMAIGLGRLFGINLPANFDSPYKATSVIEFWQRWHMTLSRFLRDYLYIPLGGNRRGTARRYANLMITMLLGGLWHGAGWTFVVWGGLHGGYIVANHGRRAVKRSLGWQDSGGILALLGSRALTFLAVVIGWVFFRAEDFSTAWHILGAMFGMADDVSGTVLRRPGIAQGWVAVLLVIAWAAPSTLDLMKNWNRPFGWQPSEANDWISVKLLAFVSWRPSMAHALLVSGIFIYCLLQMSRTSEFLYFQF